MFKWDCINSCYAEPYEGENEVKHEKAPEKNGEKCSDRGLYTLRTVRQEIRNGFRDPPPLSFLET